MKKSPAEICQLIFNWSTVPTVEAACSLPEIWDDIKEVGPKILKFLLLPISIPISFLVFLLFMSAVQLLKRIPEEKKKKFLNFWHQGKQWEEPE